MHETAIPAGIYQVVITRSQRFEKMLPLVQNVPVELHTDALVDVIAYLRALL